MHTLSKPEVTLIVSSSVDGCLMSRDSDELDSHKDWKDSPIVRGVIQQFYDFSAATNIYNLTTASTMIRIGLNEETFSPKKDPVNLIVLDLHDELLPRAVVHLAASVEKLLVVTGTKRADISKQKIPANCQLLTSGLNMVPLKLMSLFKKKYHIDNITIQSAGPFNSQWLNANVVDYLTVIVYPLVVSTNGTPTFPKGSWLEDIGVKPLQLISVNTFDTNYVSLRYKVVNT